MLVVESKLLKARIRMQQKYIDQFYMLYEDFNITKLPLLPQEVSFCTIMFIIRLTIIQYHVVIFSKVCGVEALKRFSQHFLSPYQSLLVRGTVEELEQRISILRSQLQEAELELERLQKGKQVACFTSASSLLDPF